MFLKIFITIALPAVLMASVIDRIYTEIKDIPFYIKNDLLENIESYKRLMK